MKSGLGLLLAILLGVFLAAGQCGSGSAGEDSSSSSASDESADDNDSDAKEDKESDDDDKNDDKNDDKESDSDDEKSDDGGGSDEARAVEQRLEDEGLHVEQRSSSSEDDCAAHSYGAMRDYFAEHPCRSLHRSWYEVRDDQDDRAVVAVSRVEMPDADGARDLRPELDRSGTGSITELSRDDGPYREVVYGGRHYGSSLDGDTVVVVQAEPVGGSAGADEVARRAAAAAAVG